MLTLILGLVLFILPHLLKDLTLRDQIKKQMPSEKAYLALFSAVSLAGVGLIIWGKSTASFYMIWEPPFEQRYVASLLMIPASIMAIAGVISNSYIRWYLRNPLLLGVTFWAAAHLWTNGDLASILLFASFGVWSATKLITLRQNSADLKPELKWLRHDLMAVIFGSIIYITIFVNHGYLFGVGLATQ